MSSDVIREFLVRLGYKVDEGSQRRFIEAMDKAARRAEELAKAAGVMAIGVGAALSKAASDLDDLYFASERIGAGAGNIKAFEYAVKQMGGTTQAARSALEGLAKFMRDYPGAEEWLSGNLGVKTRDGSGKLRDTVALYEDIAAALAKMPSYQATNYAGELGIDDVTLQAIRSGSLGKFMSDYRKNAAEAGVDLEKSARVAHEFAENMRSIEMSAKNFGLVLAEQTLPVMREISQVTREVLNDWTDIIRKRKIQSAPDFFTRMFEGLTGRALGGGVKLSAEAAARSRSFSGLVVNERGAQDGFESSANGAARGYSAAGLFSNLERQYGLPAGLLDRIWRQESGRGRNMLSPKGAMGHFQFMPGTAKQYGVSDPNDLNQSAAGAAKYLRDLIGMFGGDINKAVAAYNWGPGNVRRYGLGAAPSETRDYLRNVLQGGIQTQTTIVVQGSTDPVATARAVAGEQVNVANDWMRQLGGLYR